MQQIFTKNGETKVATNRRNAVALKFNGWRPAELTTPAEADPTVDTQLVEPPRNGQGSGRDPWAEFARSLGIDVTDDMTRDQIVAAVDDLDAATDQDTD